MLPFDFDYPVLLKSALQRMPDRIDVRSVLYRDLGKNPTFFNATQIEALRARHQSDQGKRPGHRQANEDDDF